MTHKDKITSASFGNYFDIEVFGKELTKKTLNLVSYRNIVYSEKS